MTVAEVKEKAAVLAVLITTFVEDFESQTGCLVHSLPVHPASGPVKVMVDVKVQIA